MQKWLVGLNLLLISLIVLGFTVGPGKKNLETLLAGASPKKISVESRVKEFGPAVDRRLKPTFASKGVAYPPKKMVLVAFKDEKVLHLMAQGDADAAPKWVKSYPVLAASGGPGPKLKEGDLQVPEGIYKVTFLNPRSRFHLSLRLGYPNSFDEKMAKVDARTNLGGDIMIHGSNKSVGCLAIGDPAVQELFVTAARIGIKNIEVIIAPTDLRNKPRPSNPQLPKWTAQLYDQLTTKLQSLDLPQP